MSQYYNIVNLTKKQYFKPLGTNSLMKFSLVGDRTMAFLYNLLKKHWKGDKVVIVGDSYEGIEGLKYHQGKLYGVEIDELYMEIKPSQFKFKLLSTFREQQKGFYVNETKKEFVSFNNLPKQFSNKIVNPLSLMIALGNNENEYNETNNFIVGRWAFDKIYVDTKTDGLKLRDEGYTEVIPHFELFEVKYNVLEVESTSEHS